MSPSNHTYTRAELHDRIAVLEAAERALSELSEREQDRADKAAAELDTVKNQYHALETMHTAMQQTALQQQEELGQLTLVNAQVKEDAKVKAVRAMDKIKEQTALILQLEKKIRDSEAEHAKQVR